MLLLKPGLSIEVLDVGQGDAILIRTPNKRLILIDAGPDDFVSFYLAYPFCDINFVIISHPHQDHLGGLKRILTKCDIGKLTFNDVSLSDFENSGFQKINSNKIQLIRNKVSKFTLDKVDFVLVKTAAAESSDPNLESLIIFATYKGHTAVFSGDSAYSSIYDAFVLAEKPTIELFLVPHHGAKDPHSLAVLSLIEPKTCPISVGKNTYGHPTSETLGNLAKVGCIVRRTDLEGTLEFEFK
jgi:beta-lactamase superfamily II metal-dependent hydrolase